MSAVLDDVPCLVVGGAFHREEGRPHILAEKRRAMRPRTT
jgi:hypothetical protein